MIQTVFKNKHMVLWLNNDIMYVQYTRKLHITLEVARECVKERLKVCNGLTYPMFVDLRNMDKIDEDAMCYLSGGDAVKHISAGAFLLKSRSHKMLATTFIWLKRPPLPTRFFTDEGKAIRWLEYYKYRNLN